MTPFRTPTGTGCALLFAALPAAAQSDSRPAPQLLPQVEVTGEAARSFSSRRVQAGAFRDQDPLDVPLTNNVVTREVLDAQGARTLYGALRNTAGVTRSQLSGSTYDNISIRGILVENRGSYRLNGSLPIVNLIDTPLENKQRVEVLKGASSLYYGLVPPSGVVNFVTKRAGEQPVTSVAASLNHYGAVDARVDVGRRFGSMGVRVNAAAGREDIGIDRFDGERALASLAWDWRVADARTARRPRAALAGACALGSSIAGCVVAGAQRVSVGGAALALPAAMQLDNHLMLARD